MSRGAVVNENEIRVVGMSRSGNHAIIDWILSQARGRRCFLNCAEPKTNPFATARPLDADGRRYRASYGEFDLAAEADGDLSRKDYLVHSYEDVFLRPFGDEAHARRHEEAVGRSRRRFDVLILRDPFNLFASRRAARIGSVSTGVAARIWCQHAREFLGLRRHLGNERLMVSYNAWVSDRRYREALAVRLGIDFDDRALRAVPRVAGGSSFDGTAHDGSAAQMRVFDRWRHYIDDPDYRAVFTPPLLKLAESVFDPLPAVEPSLPFAA